MGVITLSDKQQQVFRLSFEVLHERLTIQEFSALINKSYRQSHRIIKRIKARGIHGVLHGNKNKIPKNKIDHEIKSYCQHLLKTKYFDFNLTHFREKLFEEEKIEVNRETLRQWAHEISMVKRAKRRARTRVHKPRPRMPREGMLVQFDGSEHDWFSGEGPYCTLIGGIDDATSEVVGLEFFPGEDSLNCMKVMKDIVETKGIPEAFYLDEASYFGQKNRRGNNTQIARALSELQCEIIIAGSAQAKGRIERLWDTMQDRLIAELRLNNINRIPTANIFLKEKFMPDFNKKFSIKPIYSESMYRKISPEIDLYKTFSFTIQRKICQGNVFNFNGDEYTIKTTKNFKYRLINIRKHFDGNISFDIFGNKLEVIKLPSRKNKLKISA